MPSSLQSTGMLLVVALVFGLTLAVVGESGPAGADSFPGGNGKQAVGKLYWWLRQSAV